MIGFVDGMAKRLVRSKEWQNIIDGAADDILLA